MRVLHIGKYWAPNNGGIERFTQDLIAEQRAQGIEAYALVHGTPGSSKIQIDLGPWVHQVPVWREIAFVAIAPTYRAALRQAIETFRPEYLHIHMPNVSPIWAFTLACARNLPWVIHWHSDVIASEHSRALRWLYPLYAPYERAVLERAKLVFATSNRYLKSSAALHHVEEKCAVVPLGIPLDARPSGSTSVEALWRASLFRVLTVGRLTYYKGHRTLIDALAQAPNAQLIIVGDGSERAALQAQIDRLALRDRVRLMHDVDEVTKHALLGSAQLFCLASRERTEAFGIVLLEAMQHRLPVLASDLQASGVNEVANMPINAWRVPADDVPAWSDAITRLANLADERVRMGDAGHGRLHKEYSIQNVTHRIEQIVRTTLDPDAPRPEAHTKPLIVIPARDEQATIGEVVNEIIAAGYPDVLVIDDASTDSTCRFAREAGAVVLRPPLALGSWGAMQLGIRYAVRHNYTSVVTMDADGQHRASELPRLFRAAMMADVVIGACPSRGSRARKFAWSFFRKLTGFTLEDLTSGFRLYNAAACRVLTKDNATLIDYQDMGVLLLLRSEKLKFAEVEVKMEARGYGISRIFYSWWAVARYMVETTILCLSKLVVGGRD